MIKLLINNADGNGDVDYSKYVAPGSIQIQKSLNVPTQCTFSLRGVDNSFTLPVPRCYVRIYSTTYQKYLFTGYMTTDPAIAFIGLSRNVPGTGFQMYQYNVSCTSDDYILNIKSVPFIPAFVNMTQGQILKAIAEALAPGFFNYEYLEDGDLIPYLQYNPTTSWYEYAQQFGTASNYRYSCVDRQIHYTPFGDGPLGISYDEEAGEGTFDPSQFQSTPLTTPIVNDVTVIGAEEGGNNCEDFFIGTGFDGAFPLAHKVFGLSSNFAGSSVVLSDSWNQNTLNTQNWFAQDPADQFNYSAGALNIVSGFEVPPGLSYIYANSAVELAGSLVAQHGEVQFNDVSKGIIGGFYTDATLSTSGCFAGLNIASGPIVDVTISGATGIEISPLFNGVVVSGGISVVRVSGLPQNNAAIDTNPFFPKPPLGPAPIFHSIQDGFIVTSKVNKTYTLYTRVSAPLPVRYYQVFRSLAGNTYGGYTTNPTVTGSVSWAVTETDIFSGEFNTWTYTVTGCVLPDTVVYGLINNQQLNITLQSTSIWTPPPASLKIACEIGAGALAPIYISGNVQYTGAFITPSGGNLPIYPQNLGPEQQFDLGSGIGTQAGEIDTGQQVDTMNFYSNDLPAAGTRIRLQTWQSQAAVSRMQASGSIAHEAVVVGDNGVRATTVNNLSPLPRTSEDCDSAAVAFLDDRVGVFYQGSYNASYFFFNQFSNDIEFYPTCGRFLYVNAPNRNMVKQNTLVNQVSITITEMAGEILQYNISFGPDTYVQRVLAALVPIPTNVLEPIDTVIPPTPQQQAQIGINYLPDIIHSTITNMLTISGSQFALTLQDVLASGAVYEIRNADLNWGINDTYLVGRFTENQSILLPRNQYDQSWFIRQTAGTQTSRRTKVLRIVAPRVPSPPLLLTGDTANVNMDLNGDVRNIEGLEIRQSDDITVCYQCLVGTRFDTFINMDQLRNQLLPGELGLNGLGQFLLEPFASGNTIGTFDIVQSEVIGGRTNIHNPFTFYAILTMKEDVPAWEPGQQFALAGLTNLTGLNGVTTSNFPSIPQPTGGPILPGSNQIIVISPVKHFSPDLSETGTAVEILQGLGQFNSRLLNAHFFNLMWEYSSALAVFMPPFSAPIQTLGYRWGSQILLNIATASQDTNRTDCAFTHTQLASGAIFDVQSIQQDILTAGNPGMITTTAPVTGDLYIRTQFIDHVGSGAWSDTAHIPIGDLIASDYLAGQGSVPPAVLANLGGAGGILFYNAIGNVLFLYTLPFQIWFPNGAVVNTLSTSGVFTVPLDATGTLGFTTDYGFFPSLRNALTANPFIEFNGPYADYANSTSISIAALTGLYQDGSVPLTNGPFVAETAAPTGSTGGGGGGSFGGGGTPSCGTLNSTLQLEHKSIKLRDVYPGFYVKTKHGKAMIGAVAESTAEVCTFVSESGLTGTASLSHTLCSNGRWVSLEELRYLMKEEEVAVSTSNSEQDILLFISDNQPEELVRKLYLKGKDIEHHYLLDGFWCHNVKYPPQ